MTPRFRPDFDYLSLNSARMLLHALIKNGRSSWYTVVKTVDIQPESEKSPISLEVLYFLTHEGYVTEEKPEGDTKGPYFTITDKGRDLFEDLKAKVKAN